MAIDLGDIPSGTEPTTAEKLQIRSAIGVGQTDAPTFLAQTLASQGLANAPSLAIGTGAGFYQPTNTQISFSGNNTEAIRFTGGGIRLGTNELGWGTFAINNLILARDADGILAQRNGRAAQSFRIYSDYIDASNSDYLSFRMVSGAFWIEALKSGSGVSRNLNIGTTTGAGVLGLMTNDGVKWTVATAGHFLAASHNAYDIGAAGGVNCPKNIYAGTSVISNAFTDGTGSLSLDNSGCKIKQSTWFYWTGRSLMSSPADGLILLQNTAASDFNRLQLGSTADTHPAIARDGAGIKITGAAAGSTSWIKVPAVAVSALPSAATAGVGARSFVDDALTPVFGSAVTGGGAVTVPVYSTGSAWNVG